MLCLGVAQAEPQPTRDHLIETAQKASPTQRFRAMKFVEKAYPGVQKDIRGQLKAHYPELEHKMVDAGLAAWEKHPDLFWQLRKEVRAEYGPRMKTLRASVLADLETQYPNFEDRLRKVLSEHGLATHWVRDVENKAPGFLERIKSRTGWYPGKLRALWKKDPDSVAEVRIKPQRVRALVNAFRNQAPAFAQEWAENRSHRRMELVSALREEFPGAGPRVVASIERNDPALMGEIWTLVRRQTSDFRADLKAEVEAVLPGLEKRMTGLVESRYPDLKPQVLNILKG